MKNLDTRPERADLAWAKFAAASNLSATTSRLSKVLHNSDVAIGSHLHMRDHPQFGDKDDLFVLAVDGGNSVLVIEPGSIPAANWRRCFRRWIAVKYLVWA